MMFPTIRRHVPCRLFCFSLCTSFILSACDSSQSHHQKNQQAHSNAQAVSAPLQIEAVSSPVVQDEIDVEDQGKKLTEVAGQAAALPMNVDTADEQATSTESLPENARSFVGRYHAYISCEDAFALCEKGNAEFILNLLPNGSAHRTLMYLGKMNHEGNTLSENQSYQKNQWSYDQKNQEIVIKHENGMEVYFHVNSENNLVMDLDKILTVNKAYFSAGNPAPLQAYVLKKYSGS